jgi:hypothetical protein
MAHGFNTTQTANGFNWSVTRIEWSEELGRSITTVLKAGTKPTRAQATGAAKKWVLFFRRGGSL